MQKRVAETLIKPVENEDLGAPFSKIVLKMIKTIPREGFRNVVSNIENPYNIAAHQIRRLIYYLRRLIDQ